MVPDNGAIGVGVDVGHIGADDVSAGTDDRVIALFLITESSEMMSEQALLTESQRCS